MMIAVVALKSLKSFNTCAKLYKKRLRGRLISPPQNTATHRWDQVLLGYIYINIYIYIYILGTNFYDCSNFNGCDSTSCSLVTCLGNSFKLYISYSEYTDPTIAPNRSLPTDSAFRSKRLIDASLPRSCWQINFYIIILHGLTCILVYWLSLITHSRLIPIPIGSMVLVYMLTFGVYWWDPCHHI